MPPRPEQAEGYVFESRHISPSRFNALLSCGIAFKLKYIDGVREESSGSAAMFGSVVHRALEWWATDRTQDLLPLMRKAWIDVFTKADVPSLVEFIEAYQGLSVKAIRLEHEIRQEWAARGKESKAPRMTKQFKESAVAREIAKLEGKFYLRIQDESPWKFREDGQLAALYDESLVLAKRYEAKYSHLANAIFTEFKFEVPFRGWMLRGYIDVIEPLTNKKTGEDFIGITDYKIYARESAEQKDWRQKVIYAVAVDYLIAQGSLVLPAEYADLPIYTGVDYVRLGRRDFCQMGPEDFDRLERELQKYGVMIDNEVFLPAEKNRMPDFCPFPSQCCLRSCAAAGGSARPVEVEL